MVFLRCEKVKIITMALIYKKKMSGSRLEIGRRAGLGGLPALGVTGWGQGGRQKVI